MSSSTARNLSSIPEEDQDPLARQRIREALSYVAGESLFLYRMINYFPLREAAARDGIETMATDGFAIYYNAGFVCVWDLEEIAAVLVHEVMHNLYNHHVRLEKAKQVMPHLTDSMCNIGADYVINAALRDEGWNLPSGVLYPDHKFWKLALEPMLATMPKTSHEPNNSAPGSGDMLQPQNEDGSPMSSKDKKRQARNIFDEMMGVAKEEGLVEDDNLAKKHGGKKHGGKKHGGKLASNDKTPQQLRDYINQLAGTKIDWRSVLSRFVEEHYAGTTDLTWARPRRFWWSQYEIYTPGWQEEKHRRLAIIIDTSGSIDINKMTTFLSNLFEIFEAVDEGEVMLIFCSNTVHHVLEFPVSNPPKLDHLSRLARTGSGTAFMPAFDELKRRDPVAGAIYFTDLESPDVGKIANIKHPALIWAVDVNDKHNRDKASRSGEVVELTGI